MTEAQKLILIGIGMVLMSSIVAVVLAAMNADGVAYALDLVLVLCLGSFVNYLVNLRGGSGDRR